MPGGLPTGHPPRRLGQKVTVNQIKNETKEKSPQPKPGLDLGLDPPPRHAHPLAGSSLPDPPPAGSSSLDPPPPPNPPTPGLDPASPCAG